MFLDWQNRPEDYYTVDIEADSLQPTKVWVLCWQNVKTKEKGECRTYEEIRNFFEKTKGSYYIGHNVIKYDAPSLNRIVGTRLPLSRLIDTLVLSTLYSPSLAGGHSLEAWGDRFKKPKIEFNEFDRFSEKMVTYCHQDVEITTELFIRITDVLSRLGFSEKSIEIQHKITEIVSRQQRNGFYFDGPRAIDLYRTITSKQERLEEQVHHVFPPEKTLIATRPMFRKDGSHSAIYTKDRERYTVQELGDGLYGAYEDVAFNLGSTKQRVEKLIGLGWEPEEHTAKGFPQPFQKGELSPSLQRFLEQNNVPEVSLIAKWMMFSSISGMINTWLDNWNEETRCIHGTLFVADTLRFRHQKPNTANIPAVRCDGAGLPILGEEGYYTYESRDLWTARPNRVLVGTDAAGLELRMLAHYLNRPAFTEQVVNGDPHQYNADVAGVTRPKAKTLLYAIQYGAQAGKVAKIMGVTNKEGAKVRQEFLDRLGLTDVMNEAINEQENGRINLVDGSKIICPSPHAALNYRLQGGGARVMQQGNIFLEGHIRRNGLDSLKVGDIHDEWQYDVAPGDAKRHAELAIQSIREAGEELNMNVPLDGTSKEGLTWAQTH